jgi:hypothetical protein
LNQEPGQVHLHTFPQVMIDTLVNLRSFMNVSLTRILASISRITQLSR